MNAPLEIRPFASRSDYVAVTEYFFGASDSFLIGMGVDPWKLPARQTWLQATLADAELTDQGRKRFYVGWYLAGELVGHSCLSHIEYGVTAHLHLHLWRASLRAAGLGGAFLAESIDLYFERFELQTIASEPLAQNPGPNHLLANLGLHLVRQYRTVPTAMSREQEVNRYEIGRHAWATRGGVRT